MNKESKSIVILTGDYNADEDEESIKLLVKNDTTKLSSSSENNSEGTFHEFSGDADEKIDYIFYNESVCCDNYEVIKDNFNGKYPSDHFPIISDLNIKNGFPLFY